MYRWNPQWQHWGDEEYARRCNRPHQYGSGLFHRASHFLHRGYHRVRLGILIIVLNGFLRVTLLCSPLYGGTLAKPQERWPHIFQSKFWATYPYFLPSLVSGCFTLFTFLICTIFMREVRHRHASSSNWLLRNYALLTFSRCHRKRAKSLDQRALQSKILQITHLRTTHNLPRC
jgi:hypothetical protein